MWDHQRDWWQTWPGAQCPQLIPRVSSSASPSVPLSQLSSGLAAGLWPHSPPPECTEASVAQPQSGMKRCFPSPEPTLRGAEQESFSRRFSPMKAVHLHAPRPLPALGPLTGRFGGGGKVFQGRRGSWLLKDGAGLELGLGITSPSLFPRLLAGCPNPGHKSELHILPLTKFIPRRAPGAVQAPGGATFNSGGKSLSHRCTFFGRPIWLLAHRNCSCWRPLRLIPVRWLYGHSAPAPGELLPPCRRTARAASRLMLCLWWLSLFTLIIKPDISDVLWASQSTLVFIISSGSFIGKSKQAT